MNKGNKVTGGKYHAERKKKSFERSVQERKVLLGDIRKKQIRMRGGSMKTVLFKANTANIKTPSGIKRAEIKNVLETPQNKFLARQNRLMKGVIIDTSLGKARITNRPSQEGQVNAVLIE